MALADIKDAYSRYRDEYCQLYMHPVTLRFEDDPGGTRVILRFSNRGSKSRTGVPTCFTRDLGVFAPEEKSAFYAWVKTIFPAK